MSIQSLKSDSIQPGTSLVKFARSPCADPPAAVVTHKVAEIKEQLKKKNSSESTEADVNTLLGWRISGDSMV